MTGTVAGICVHLCSSAVSDRRLSNSFRNVFKNRRERRGTQRETTTLCTLPTALLRRPRPLRLIFFAMIHLIRKKLKSHSDREDRTVTETETVIGTVAGGGQ